VEYRIGAKDVIFNEFFRIEKAQVRWERWDGSMGKAVTRYELVEEIGVAPERMQYLISFFLSPGAIDEKFHLFYASIQESIPIKRVGGNKEEEEDLLIGLFEKQKLFMMIEREEISDAKTIASILFYFGRNR